MVGITLFSPHSELDVLPSICYSWAKNQIPMKTKPSVSEHLEYAILIFFSCGYYAVILFFAVPKDMMYYIVYTLPAAAMGGMTFLLFLHFFGHKLHKKS